MAKPKQPCPTKEELDCGRRLERRRYARISFGIICVKSACVTAFMLLHPDRKDVASALATAAPLLTGLIGLFTAIILGYFAASTTESVMTDARTKIEDTEK